MRDHEGRKDPYRHQDKEWEKKWKKKMQRRRKLFEMKKSVHHHKIMALIYILYAVLMFSISYSILSFIFQAAGISSPLIVHITGAFLGLTLILVSILLFARLLANPQMEENPHRNFYDDLFKALDSIAHGDFSVIIETPNNQLHHGFYDLAEKVNNMAQNLSTMETMRKDFISNVSHEIQSPLTSITGFAALLKNRNLSWEEQQNYIGIIESESKRLSKLSDNLLRLSSLDSGASKLHLTTYSLDRQIKDLILSMEPQWVEKDINFNIDLPQLSISADVDLLSQVWINLISNSIKFSPLRGEITLSAVESETDVAVTIKDCGPGIPEDQQDRIFERFYMVDKARKRDLGGNGLGLSIASKITAMHGGSITVESRPGAGAAFTVRLPKSEQRAV